jgi:hypothetical protein
MRTLLFTIAGILFLGWIICLILKVVGFFIHLLLVLAIIAIVVAFIKKRKD